MRKGLCSHLCLFCMCMCIQISISVFIYTLNYTTGPSSWWKGFMSICNWLMLYDQQRTQDKVIHGTSENNGLNNYVHTHNDLKVATMYKHYLSICQSLIKPVYPFCLQAASPAAVDIVWSPSQISIQLNWLPLHRHATTNPWSWSDSPELPINFTL